MHDDLSGRQLPHGYRTEIRRLMQESYFVIPEPEMMPGNLERITEILTDIISGGYEINRDFVEARSLATVAAIVLREVIKGYDT